MTATALRPLRDLPRGWLERLFRAMVDDHGEDLWPAFAEIVLEVLPEDVVVVWETFETFGYRRDGSVNIATMRGAESHGIRAPVIYNTLNLGFEERVREFDEAAMIAAGLVDIPALAHLRPLHAVTIDHLHDGQLLASLVCYGKGDAAQARVKILETLRPVLSSCAAALFDRRRSIAAGKGLSEFLREVPVGLILVDWFGTVVAVNDEGYRQAVVWNEAPQRPNLKRARQRFSVPLDLQEGWHSLQGAWIGFLRGENARPEALVVRNAATSALSALIELVHDPDVPNAAPCFMARFAGIHARSRDDPLIPSVAQVAILARLSPAERVVALRVQEGMSNAQIAQELGRQIGTVKDHLTSIYGKLGIVRRTQLAGLLLDVGD